MRHIPDHAGGDPGCFLIRTSKNAPHANSQDKHATRTGMPCHASIATVQERLSACKSRKSKCAGNAKARCQRKICQL